MVSKSLQQIIPWPFSWLIRRDIGDGLYWLIADVYSRFRERGCNQNILGLELCGSGAEVPLNWNIQTGMWLRYCEWRQ